MLWVPVKIASSQQFCGKKVMLKGRGEYVGGSLAALRKVPYTRHTPYRGSLSTVGTLGEKENDCYYHRYYIIKHKVDLKADYMLPSSLIMTVICSVASTPKYLNHSP